MSVGFLGYVTNFVGVGAIVNGTTRKATTYSTDGKVITPRLWQMTNGVWVHYDGTSDALESPGTVTQEFFDTSGHAGLFDTLRASLGKLGDVTMTEVDGVTTHVAAGILIEVIDNTPIQGNRNKIWCQCTWKILEDWT
jgi:hypothetical protein